VQPAKLKLGENGADRETTAVATSEPVPAASPLAHAHTTARRNRVRRSSFSKTDTWGEFPECGVEVGPDLFSFGLVLFARAYSSLATVYSDAGENALAATYATKAFQLRDHCIPVERNLIDAAYHSSVTGNLAKAAEAYRLLANARPRSSNPHINLDYIDSQLGEYEKGLAETLRGVSLGPNAEGYSNMMSDYIALGRLNEAKATFSEGESRNMTLPLNHNDLYMIAFLEHDQTAMEREAAWVMGKPRTEDANLYFQSCTNAYFGKLKEARALSRRARDSALRAGQKETATG
jgi:tetratricopeptide (TPR) repeat protein